ncbi:Hypothetical predicted protein [Paramuricea clavata]|uniref:FP protein C-terminal domain-containing protein n=1 Tax=Paramuricea clavata TaxID=317549 RepID=A0A7D9F1D0_PARCT|nr:Hypothetical predicted protein [Paramuricea clavata]
MATAKLKKENSELREEIALLNVKLSQVTKDFDKKIDKYVEQESGYLAEQTKSLNESEKKSIQFISDQYDVFAKFKENSMKDLKLIKSQIDITGVPQQREAESAEETTALCIKLLHAIGATDISEYDIDIAHRVPARQRTHMPNAIICKFTRRIARHRVLAVKKRTEGLKPAQLELPSTIQMGDIRIYEHLTPRLQELLYEANKFKRAQQYKFCWVKNKAICLRKSDGAPVIRLLKLDDLESAT